jgi:hypothetical protein
MGLRHLVTSQASCLALALLTAVVSTGSAQELTAVNKSNLIPLIIGFARTLRLERPVRTVIIGNPTVAEAIVQNDKLVVVTAKSAGRTDLIVLDDKNNEILNALITTTGDPGRVYVFGRSGQGAKGRDGLHEFYTYSCTPVCERLKDEPLTVYQQAALQNRTPLIEQTLEQQSAPLQQNTPAPSAPAQ